MSKFIPLSIRISEATKSLKNYGYIVINTDDTNFAILKEKKKIICNSHNEFLNKAKELMNSN